MGHLGVFAICVVDPLILILSDGRTHGLNHLVPCKPVLAIAEQGRWRDGQHHTSARILLDGRDNAVIKMAVAGHHGHFIRQQVRLHARRYSSHGDDING